MPESTSITSLAKLSSRFSLSKALPKALPKGMEILRKSFIKYATPNTNTLAIKDEELPAIKNVLPLIEKFFRFGIYGSKQEYLESVDNDGIHSFDAFLEILLKNKLIDWTWQQFQSQAIALGSVHAERFNSLAIPASSNASLLTLAIEKASSALEANGNDNNEMSKAYELTSNAECLRLALSPEYIGTNYTVFLMLYDFFVKHRPTSKSQSRQDFHHLVEKSFPWLIAHHTVEEAITGFLERQVLPFKMESGFEGTKNAMKDQLAWLITTKLAYFLDPATRQDSQITTLLLQSQELIQEKYCRLDNPKEQHFTFYLECTRGELLTQQKESRFYLALKEIWGVAEEAFLRSPDTVRLGEIGESIRKYALMPATEPEYISKEPTYIRNETETLLSNKNYLQRHRIITSIGGAIQECKYQERDSTLEEVQGIASIKAAFSPPDGKSWKERLMYENQPINRESLSPEQLYTQIGSTLFNMQDSSAPKKDGVLTGKVTLSPHKSVSFVLMAGMQQQHFDGSVGYEFDKEKYVILKAAERLLRYSISPSTTSESIEKSLPCIFNQALQDTEFKKNLPNKKLDKTTVSFLFLVLIEGVYRTKLTVGSFGDYMVGTYNTQDDTFRTVTSVLHREKKLNGKSAVFPDIQNEMAVKTLAIQPNQLIFALSRNIWETLPTRHCVRIHPTLRSQITVDPITQECSLEQVRWKDTPTQSLTYEHLYKTESWIDIPIGRDTLQAIQQKKLNRIAHTGNIAGNGASLLQDLQNFYADQEAIAALFKVTGLDDMLMKDKFCTIRKDLNISATTPKELAHLLHLCSNVRENAHSHDSHPGNMHSIVVVNPFSPVKQQQKAAEAQVAM